MDAAPVVLQPVASAALTETARPGGPEYHAPSPAPSSQVTHRAWGKSEIRISKSETNPNKPKSHDPNGCGWFGCCGNSVIRACSASGLAGGHSRESGNRHSCFELAGQWPYLRESTQSADAVLPGGALPGTPCGPRGEIIGLAGGGWPMKKGTQHSDAPGGCHGARPRSAGIVYPERNRGDGRETVEGARATAGGCPRNGWGHSRHAQGRPAAGPARRGGEIPWRKRIFR
jgi:hypothetical protein